MLAPKLGITPSTVVNNSFYSHVVKFEHPEDDPVWTREIAIRSHCAEGEFLVSLEINEYQEESRLCLGLKAAQEYVEFLCSKPRSWFEEKHRTPAWLRKG